MDGLAHRPHGHRNNLNGRIQVPPRNMRLMSELRCKTAILTDWYMQWLRDGSRHKGGAYQCGLAKSLATDYIPALGFIIFYDVNPVSWNFLINAYKARNALKIATCPKELFISGLRNNST